MNDEADVLYGANVATVPQRSPFRYPGGKTWLIPHVRQWLEACGEANMQLVEPFAGGAIVSLTAVFEDLVGSAALIERDRRVRDVWRAILGRSGRRLAEQIRTFEFNEENLRATLQSNGTNLRERAFRTLLRNRVNRNGIIADGAGMVRVGEYGLGRRSRWYPDTISQRILSIVAHKERIEVPRSRDGRRYLKKRADEDGLIYFLDPPYRTVGRRLYRHADVRPRTVFERAAALKGDFLLTYRNTPEIRDLARTFGFSSRIIRMRNGHNSRQKELLIGRDLSWASG